MYDQVKACVSLSSYQSSCLSATSIVAPHLCDDQPVHMPAALQAANEGLERALADARRQCASALSPRTMRGASSSESVGVQHSAAALIT